MGNNDTEFSTGIDPTDEYGNAQGKLAMQKIKKQQEFHDLLSSAMSRNSNVTPTQAFAASALALLPVLVGKHYAGTAGAAIGAKAGGLGSSSYLGGIQQGANEQKALDIFQAKRAASEIDDLTQQENSLARTNLYLQGQKELQDIKAQNRLATKPTVEAEAQDPLAKQWLVKRMRGETTTPEEDAAAAGNSKTLQAGIAASRVFTPKHESSDPFSNMGQASRDKLIERGTIAQMANELGDEVSSSNGSLAEILAAKNVSAADAALIQQRISRIADDYLRSKSGAAAPPAEKKNLEKIISGDFSVDSQLMGKMLKTFAREEASRASKMVDFAKDPNSFVSSMQRISSQPPSYEGISSKDVFKQALIKRGIAPDRAEALTLQKYGG